MFEGGSSGEGGFEKNVGRIKKEKFIFFDAKFSPFQTQTQKCLRVFFNL